MSTSAPAPLVVTSTIESYTPLTVTSNTPLLPVWLSVTLCPALSPSPSTSTLNVFVEPEVKERFKQMTLVQLYTDGGPNHRENQNYEIERFGTAALPYYVILSPEDEIISTFPGMTRKLNEFIDFLDAGLEG